MDLPAEIHLPIATPEEETIATPEIVIQGVDRHGKERGKLLLGHREKGLLLANGARLKGLYQVRSTILDQIPSKASLLQGQGTP